MNLFILGATGATGIQLLNQALESGHAVTVYVRDAKKVSKRPNLTIIEGQLHDEALIKDSLANQNVVLFALGYRSLNDQSRLFSKTIKILLPAMKEKGVDRLIYESAYGIGETEPDLGFFFGKIIKPLLLSNPYADHVAAEELIRQSGLKYVIVRPVGLTNGPLTKTYLTQERLEKNTMRISRADVAHFMLDQITQDQWLGKSVGIAYKK